MRHPNDADSVGRLEGLHRRHLKADVELIDALDPLTRRTVAAWLADRPSPARRQACLRILASWLRWLRAAEPALEPLATCGAHVDAYCYAALTTGVYLYRIAFIHGDMRMGYAAAMSLFLGLVNMAITIVIFKALRTEAA